MLIFKKLVLKCGVLWWLAIFYHTTQLEPNSDKIDRKAHGYMGYKNCHKKS